jgi:hypothetical protein
MNERSDIGRVLRHWFEDGPDSMPDRVVDTVAARISVNRQRRMVHLVGRTAPVNRIFTYLAAAAAVVIAAVAIWQFLPANPASSGGQPTPTATAPPTPVALPSPAPSASAACPQWYTDGCSAGAGILPAGSHETTSFRPGFTFIVPAGWVNDSDEVSYFSLFPETPANQTEFTRSEGMAQKVFMGPHGSPWFTCESLENNRGATSAEIATAMTASEVLAVSDPVDVAIGGLTGKQVDVRRNPDWTGTCPGDSELPAGLDPRDERTRVILLDAPGRGVLVMFLYSTSSAEFEAFLTAVMPIVESFEFDIGQ